MSSHNVVEFTDDNFKKEVLESNLPVLVDFWAPWCGPCRQITPSVEALATEYHEKAKVGKVNVDDNQAVSAQFGIRSIPALLFFKDGKVVDQIVGAVPKAQIEEQLKKHL